jgi:1-deoxy-D-xylulose-5-phosphate reductoisomerase
MKRISILGSTGSVGTNTLQVVARYPERFAVVGLAAGRNLERLAQQVGSFRPELVSVADSDAAKRLRETLGPGRPEILWGPEGAIAVATAPGVDLVVSALVGALGLLPTLRAVEGGRDLALANKEVLVMAGELVLRAAATSGSRLLPVDSEHSALFQCLLAGRREEVRRLILTASGGPFRDLPRERLDAVTVEQALRHPTWNMGPKITIDSATLMNKGFEILEAHWLFGMPPEAIEVVVHPQSIVHSLVEYCDGSMIAQLGIADMKLPILYALAYPERLPTHTPPLDLRKVGPLEFFPPDRDKFPCLDLAGAAARVGGSLPVVLNAANEVAVAAFLEGRIRFPDIARVIAEVMEAHSVRPLHALDDVTAIDADTRRAAESRIGQLPRH